MRVVLEKLFVFAFVVELVALMLSESVDALVVIERAESLAYGVRVGVLYRYRLERPFGLLKYFLAFVIEEGYLAGLFVDSGFTAEVSTQTYRPFSPVL